jgi:hypothetical protein
MSAERTVALLRHPESRGGAVRAIRARVRRTPEGALAVAFTVEADVARLRVPAPRPPRFAGRLWEHNCCEVFVARRGEPGYREINLSPSGEWAAYAFERYRERAQFDGLDGLDAEAAGSDPGIVMARSKTVLELEATIRLDRLLPARALALGLSAVIEHADGSLSYWAIAHPPGRPDFHHTDAFALDIE